MLDLLESVDPAEILSYARSIPTPEDFLLTREIVPETFIENIKYRIKSRERRVSVAKYRAYDTETPFGRRDVKHTVMEGMLPPLGKKLFVGEMDTILFNLSKGADVDAELVAELFDDIDNEVLGIKARLELAAGDLIVDGVFTLQDENNLTIDADYEMDAGFLPTAGVFWSNPAAPALDDEKAWIAKLIKDGDGRPGDRMASFEVISMLAKNTQYKQYYHGNISLTDAATRPTLTEAQVTSVRSSNGLPPIREYDVEVLVDNVSQRVTPVNRFFLLPAVKKEWAETQYGITAESIALSRAGNPRIVREELPGIVTTAREEDDPVKVWTKSTAVAMPVMYSNQAHICAKVLAD